MSPRNASLNAASEQNRYITRYAEVEIRMMKVNTLTIEEREQYARDGYIVREAVLTPDEVETLRAASEELCRRLADASSEDRKVDVSEFYVFEVDMLRDVIRRGTGQRARALGREDIAGKTGTTQQGRDAWFSGFNPDLVATAWVGFDQERPLGAGEEGARTALPMWIYFMRDALAGLPQHRLPMPDGVVTARVGRDPSEFGDEPAGEFEYFLADHLPAGVSGKGSAEGEPPPQKYEEPIF